MAPFQVLSSRIRRQCFPRLARGGIQCFLPLKSQVELPAVELTLPQDWEVPPFSTGQIATLHHQPGIKIPRRTGGRTRLSRSAARGIVGRRHHRYEPRGIAPFQSAASAYRAGFLARIMHEPPAATTNKAVLSGVLGSRTLRRIEKVCLRSEPLWLPGGATISTISLRRLVHNAGYHIRHSEQLAFDDKG